LLDSGNSRNDGMWKSLSFLTLPVTIVLLTSLLHTRER
jgi:hypothetical protein